MSAIGKNTTTENKKSKTSKSHMTSSFLESYFNTSTEIEM